MKRLVYRADDIGYTLAFDLGAFKGMDEGIITSADVMLDSPHTEEALLWLKKGHGFQSGGIVICGSLLSLLRKKYRIWSMNRGGLSGDTGIRS